MKKGTWKKHHKWFGLLFCFFILLFSLSGIILNHRTLVSQIDISRKYLPSLFEYKKWNNNFLRGTISLQKDTNTVFIYGSAGIFKSDKQATFFKEFNKGFPQGVDNRNIQAMAETPSLEMFAAAQFTLYKYDSNKGWIVAPNSPNERLTDIITHLDSLILATRSHLYISIPPYQSFEKIEIQKPKGYNGKVTLFRTVWLLHSGELFGIVGKIFMDLLAVILIILSVTGILYWCLPKYIKRLKQKGVKPQQSVRLLKGSLNWHNIIGRYTIILTLFVSFTGWCLRPPILIPLAKNKVSPLPGTILQSDNPWNDKLRAIRFDTHKKEWLLSTSEGFYSLKDLKSTPQKLGKVPPVSVMGVNVLEKDSLNQWIVGSFSGLFTWNRDTEEIVDYFTGEIPSSTSGAPFGKRAISGFSKDFKGKECIVEYENGSNFAEMPNEFRVLPMSLWNVALEVHTGRIYTLLGSGTLVFISFAGLIVFWVLISGYIVRKKKK